MSPRPTPPVSVNHDLPALSLRVPNLPPTTLSLRVTVFSPVFTPNKPPPHPASPAPVRAAPWMRGLSPAPGPASIETDRDDPVFQLRYHLRPLARPSPSNRLQDGTQPHYVAALSQLLQQEEQANVFIDPSSGRALKYRHLIRGPDGATWVKDLAKSLGRLVQGVGTRMPTGTNTVFFVSKSYIPYD